MTKFIIESSFPGEIVSIPDKILLPHSQVRKLYYKLVLC
jgi:hypothetical protein